MEKPPNEKSTFIVIDLLKLTPPDYHQKETIEGRESQLIKSIERNGVKSPILINRFPGRENIIINGVSVVNACKKLKIERIPAYVVRVPLEQEKELHFSLNNATTQLSSETIKALLDRTYTEYFPGLEFDEEDKVAMNGTREKRQTKMNDRVKPITSHVNHEERKRFETARQNLGCKSDSETVKKLTDYYLKDQGII